MLHAIGWGILTFVAVAAFLLYALVQTETEKRLLKRLTLTGLKIASIIGLAVFLINL